MRSFKKIVFIILALLPLIALIVNCLQMHSAEVVEYIPLGTVEVVDGVFVVEENTWSDRLLTDLGATQKFETGFWYATTNFISFLHVNAGIPCSLPLVLAFWYFMYMFFIILVECVIDLITWIPRKVHDLFNN